MGLKKRDRSFERPGISRWLSHNYPYCRSFWHSPGDVIITDQSRMMNEFTSIVVEEKKKIGTKKEKEDWKGGDLRAVAKTVSFRGPPNRISYDLYSLQIFINPGIKVSIQLV
jgi:hypothetical protein